MTESKPYLFVVGALLINLTLGTFYSIGNLFPYVASYMRNNGNPDVTTEDGTWITASFLLGQGFSMILGAYIERKYNNRIACIIGCVLHCTSTFFTIWTIKVSLPAVIVVYGLGSGLGAGSTYVASIIAAQKWFPNRKGLLTGMIVAGFGFGGLVFTPLQTLFLNPDNKPPNSAGYFDRNIYDKVPSLFLYMGLIFTFLQAIGCILAFNPPPAPGADQSPSRNTTDTSRTNNTNNPTGTTVTEEVLPELKSYSDAFKLRIFYITGVMMMLVAPGVTFVNSLGKKYGQAYIQDDRFLAIVVAVAAVANASGRLFWGCLMDRFTFSTCYTVKVILFTILIVLFPFGFILSSKALYFIWMLGLFFGFSGTFVLFPLFIEQVFGVKYHGIIYGILYIALAIASILTSLLLKVTVSKNSNSNNSNPDDALLSRIGTCIVIGALYVISYVLYTLLIPVRRLENAINRRKEMTNAMMRNSLFNRTDLYPMDRLTLAEKTQANAHATEPNTNSSGGPDKDNSLGSIVRFRDSPKDNVKRINTLAK